MSDLVEKNIAASKIPDRIEDKEAAAIVVRWETMPKRERDSLKALAEKINISRDTIYRWRDSNWYQNLVRHEVLKELASERREVYDALIKEAKGGDVKAIRHYSELLGDHVKQIDITSDGDSLSDEQARSMTTEELAESLINSRLDDAAYERKLKELDAGKEEVMALLIDLLEG